MPDPTLKKLKVYYECYNGTYVNERFDKDMLELAEKYGVRFSGSGGNLTTGTRDLEFKAIKSRK